MAIVDGSLQLGYKDSAWFTSNASVVLLVGQIVYLEQTGTYKIGDGVTALSALSFLGGSSTTPNLQEVTDEGASTTNAINAPQYSTSGGEVTITDNSVIVLDNASTGNLLEVDRTTDSIKKLGAEIATVNDLGGYLPTTGGNLTGLLGEAKSTNIASATTTDLSTATGNLVHITGTTTITSFGTVQAGTKIDIVFDGILILTNSANIILPGNVSITTGVNDTATFISEGGGVWRCLSYFRYDESYTNYTPSFTGFSTPPTITPGDWRWKMISKNTCHVIGWTTTSGTSNSTAMTVTLPFTAAWTGGSGYGLQESPMMIVNNGTRGSGSVRTKTGGSNILDVFFTTFTASGAKDVRLNFIYQIEI